MGEENAAKKGIENGDIVCGKMKMCFPLAGKAISFRRRIPAIKMERILLKIGKWPGTAVFILTAAALSFGQAGSNPRPLMQRIVVVREDLLPAPSPSPLVTRTGSSEAVDSEALPPAPVVYANSPFPILAETLIPGRSGVLVESLNGDVIVESSADTAFNPASNVKIATAYAVLITFGPNYRFMTNVWTDGALDAETGILDGNLYVSGRDPVFAYEHAVLFANELNRMGIRSITGSLVVTENFVMNRNSSDSRSARGLLAALDSEKRSAAATRAWSDYRFYSGRAGRFANAPGVSISGEVISGPIPTGTRLLFSHESAAMRDVVKAMLSYSNNFLADRLGEMLGGPLAVARIVHQHAGVTSAEFYMQTSSGLGKNRVTPKAMMKLLRALRAELAKFRMNLSDILPVAGMDEGTLENRFDTNFSRGTIVGKTGTLSNTDGGVSSLAGEMNTRGGKLLFVIFNQRGRVTRFRAFQNSYVALIQGQLGGAAQFDYSPISIEARLATNRISYPESRFFGN